MIKRLSLPWPRGPLTVRFVPADRFFLRIVPLDAALPAREQVELALETYAPFPLAQLYWGFLPAPDGRQALIYAGHRRRLAAEVGEAGPAVDLVVPDGVMLLGGSRTAGEVVLWAGEDRLVGAMWGGDPAWPTVLLARSYPTMPGEPERQALVRELAERAGMAPATVGVLHGEPVARRDGADLVFALKGSEAVPLPSVVLTPGRCREIDVRDREVLARHHRERTQRGVRWAVLAGAGVAAVLAFVVELGAAGLAWSNQRRHEQLALQAPEVERIERQHALATRVEELSRQRLRFFEMIKAVNEVRPASIQFVRTGSLARQAVEIEAQTNRTEDVAQFEKALKAVPAVARVEINSLRSRDGQTTFVLVAGFGGPGEDGAPVASEVRP